MKHQPELNFQPFVSDDIISGRSGMILYYYQKWKNTQSDDDYNQIESLIQSVFEGIENRNANFFGTGFGNGITGFTHVCAFLIEEGFLDLNIAEVFSEIDEFLYEDALKSIQEFSTDFLHSSLGILHYFSFRSGEDTIRGYIESLVKELLQTAIVDEKGLRFRNTQLQRNIPEYNLSLSHGLTGILLVLLKIYEKDILKQELRHTIEEGTKYILSYLRDPNIYTKKDSFGAFYVNSETNQPFYGNRLGWCYGDLNVILLLYRAGNLLDNALWVGLADHLGSHAVQRKSEEETMIAEYGFCHGSSGVALFYNTLFKIRPLTMYQDTSVYWLNQTKMHLKNKRLGKNLPGILEGEEGAKLVLLSLEKNNPVTWASLFLI